MAVPTQLFFSGNVSWSNEEQGKNASMYLNIKYDQTSAIIVITSMSFVTIFLVILTMALIALILVRAIKTWLAMRGGEHSNDFEMDILNEDNVWHSQQLRQMITHFNQHDAIIENLLIHTTQYHIFLDSISPKRT